MPKQTDTLIRWLAWTVFTLNAFLQKSCSNHGQTHRGNRQSAVILEKKSAEHHSVGFVLSSITTSLWTLPQTFWDSCRELTQLHDASVSKFFNKIRTLQSSCQTRTNFRNRCNDLIAILPVTVAQIVLVHGGHNWFARHLTEEAFLCVLVCCHFGTPKQAWKISTPWCSKKVRNTLPKGLQNISIPVVVQRPTSFR